MSISPTQLRSNIYQILDQVLETGVAVEIERHGRILRLAPVQPIDKLSRLEPHPDFIIGDPLDIVDIDWSECGRRSEPRMDPRSVRPSDRRPGGSSG